MSVVFILGAGASADAGAPLMGNFLDKARDIWALGKIEDDQARDSSERVFKLISKLQAVHSKCDINLRNIESILAALDMGKTLDWLPGYDQRQIDELIDDVSTLICLTIENSIAFPLKGGVVENPPYYQTLVNVINNIRTDSEPSRAVSVITFNYDLLCDRSLLAKGLSPDYCLEGAVNDQSTPLLKVHGSLNWVRCPDCDGRIYPVRVNRNAEKFFPGNKLPPKRVVHSAPMPISRWLKEESPCEHLPANEPKAPFIVPPTWNKTDHHRAIAPVWKAAAKVLSQADHIFVIGYSFPGSDAFFHYLYGLGTLGENPLRKFAVFNPDKNEVEARFRRLLGRAAEDVFEYHAMTFGGALYTIPNYFPKGT